MEITALLAGRVFLQQQFFRRPQMILTRPQFALPFLRREFGLGELGTFLLLGTAIFRLRGPDVRAIDGSFREGGKVILVNIGVLMCALIVSEGVARLPVVSSTSSLVLCLRRRVGR